MKNMLHPGSLIESRKLVFADSGLLVELRLTHNNQIIDWANGESYPFDEINGILFVISRVQVNPSSKVRTEFFYYAISETCIGWIESDERKK